MRTPTRSLAEIILELKKGDRFQLKSEGRRIQACKELKTLRDAKMLKMDITTRKTRDGRFFLIAL